MTTPPDWPAADRAYQQHHAAAPAAFLRAAGFFALGVFAGGAFLGAGLDAMGSECSGR